MDVTMGKVGSILPSDDFKVERPFVRHTAFEALFGQNTQLNFCHVEPRTMRWGEMKAQSESEAVCLGFAKGFD